MKIYDLTLDLIHKWEPKEKYRSEKRYIDDLQKYLYTEFNSYKGGFTKKKIEVKETKNASSCDLLIDNSVGVEIKKGIGGKIDPSKIGRIYDEILKNKEIHKKGVIFVLVGKINTNTKNRIEERIKKLAQLTKLKSILPQFIVNDYKVILVNKSDN